jgi:transposase
MVDLLAEMVALLGQRITRLDQEIARRARTEDVPSRLMTIPGVGPITATAIAALAPPVETFRRGRDFAAWLGLTPRQHSTGGKQKLGATTKMGERTIRRLLIIGARAVLECVYASLSSPWAGLTRPSMVGPAWMAGSEAGRGERGDSFQTETTLAR